MWMVKGIGLGLALFAVFVIFRFAMFWPKSKGAAMGVGALYGLTIGSVFFWVALASCVGLGLSIMDSIPVRVQP